MVLLRICSVADWRYAHGYHNAGFLYLLRVALDIDRQHPSYPRTVALYDTAGVNPPQGNGQEHPHTLYPICVARLVGGTAFGKERVQEERGGVN